MIILHVVLITLYHLVIIINVKIVLIWISYWRKVGKKLLMFGNKGCSWMENIRRCVIKIGSWVGLWSIIEGKLIEYRSVANKMFEHRLGSTWNSIHSYQQKTNTYSPNSTNSNSNSTKHNPNSNNLPILYQQQPKKTIN